MPCMRQALVQERLGAFVLRNRVDRGDSYTVCSDKLRRRLPAHLFEDFGPRYYQRVIDKYISESVG